MLHSIVEYKEALCSFTAWKELYCCPMAKGHNWQFCQNWVITTCQTHTFKLLNPKKFQQVNFRYKSMGVSHSNWQLSWNNQCVSYALLSWVGSIVPTQFVGACLVKSKKCLEKCQYWHAFHIFSDLMTCEVSKLFSVVFIALILIWEHLIVM